MSQSFNDYHAALECAQADANRLGLDCGIRKTKEYGKTVFVVSLLPRESHSFGADYLAERVKPYRAPVSP